MLRGSIESLYWLGYLGRFVSNKFLENHCECFLPDRFIDICMYVGRYRVVDITNRHGQDGPGIESRWGRCFPHPSRESLGPTQPPMQWVPGLPPGVKRPGLVVDQPLPSSAEVKERVELFIYSPSGPSGLS